VEVDALAATINRLVCDYGKTRLSRLSEAGPEELWEAVRATSTKSVCKLNLLLGPILRYAPLLRHQM